jgi:hypothetical protein
MSVASTRGLTRRAADGREILVLSSSLSAAADLCQSHCYALHSWQMNLLTQLGQGASFGLDLKH